MKDLMSAAIPLLDDLYEQATAQDENWQAFLTRFADLFHADTASLRLTRLDDPVVYRSFTVGFDENANTRYESGAALYDPFREPLAQSRLGSAVQSPSIISDRDFENSEHYQNIFRPNGNFYALGSQFLRKNGQAMHVGVHRPKAKGAFTAEEMKVVEMLTPHFRRAVGLCQLVTRLNQSLTDAESALDRLTFGVWRTDGNLQVQWMNSVAEEAIRTGTYGLHLQRRQLRPGASSEWRRLRHAAKQLREHRSASEALKLGDTGACLVMTRSRYCSNAFHPDNSTSPGILCFLLDPSRPDMLDRKQATILYELTPAECRLANLLVGGLDVNEASSLLQISPHTGRTQMKSIMRKARVNRQTALQRKLLMCTTALRHDDE